MQRCKYCRRKDKGRPCGDAREANACEHAHPDVIYADKPRTSGGKAMPAHAGNGRSVPER